VGYNCQFAPAWMVGIEGDFAWGSNNNTLPGIPALGFRVRQRRPSPSTAARRESTGMSWSARLPVRHRRHRLAGRVADRKLPWGHRAVLDQSSESFDKVITGWTVGGGFLLQSAIP
jgi:hypothetical protein